MIARLVASTTVLVMLVGCRDDGAGGRAVEHGQASSLLVHRRGDEPRRQLRYSLLADRSLGGRADISVRSQAPGSPIPPRTRADFALIRREHTDAATSYRVVVNAVASEAVYTELAAGPPVPGLESALRALNVGLAVPSFALGSAKDAASWASAGEAFDPERLMALALISAALQPVPLPQEAVGLDAAWELQRSIELSGVRGRQVFRYRLSALGRDGARIDLQMSLKAEPQTVALGDGGSVKLQHLEISTSGSSRIRLDRPLPPRLTLQGAESFSYEGAAGPQHGNCAGIVELSTFRAP